MPQGDVVENYTPFGYFSSGGGEGGYTPVIKRAILQYFYRAYGPESPEYQAAAKRWPKQAHKVEKNPPPRGGVPQVGGRAGDQPLQPIYNPYDVGRGISVSRGVNPPSKEFLLGSAQLLASVYGGEALLGIKAIGVGAKKLIAKLLARRAALGKALPKQTGRTLDEIFEARAKRAPRMPSESKDAYAKRLAKMKTDLGGPAKVSVKDVPAGKQAGPGGKPVSAASARAARLKDAIAAGGAAGAAAQIVQEIIARATLPPGAATVRPPRNVTPGSQPGSGAASSSEASRNSTPATVATVPTGSQTARPGAAPGRPGAAGATRGSTRVARSSSPAGMAGILARLGIPTSLPQLVQEAEKQLLARLINPPARAPAPIVFPPIPQPVPQPSPLTGFGPGGVGFRSSCECPPKKPRKPKKPRDVCYSGKYIERSDGTTKTKLRKVPCLPSRKKPASALAR